MIVVRSTVNCLQSPDFGELSGSKKKPLRFARPQTSTREREQETPPPSGTPLEKRGDRWYAGCRIINNPVEALNC